jgi:hypothetical protein
VDFDKLADQDFKEEVIVVTGSTIGRRTVTTPAPLTILDRDLLQAAGQPTLGDIIQQLPAQQNGVNAQINAGGDGSTRVDIRGLTSSRTLTLINGRRVVPGGNGANGSVDLSMIPLAIVDRVEVLKDGASAVYGSDAIGGVVNIITRSDFDGNEASLYTGSTQHSDGLAYEASFVTGSPPTCRSRTRCSPERARSRPATGPTTTPATWWSPADRPWCPAAGSTPPRSTPTATAARTRWTCAAPACSTAPTTAPVAIARSSPGICTTRSPAATSTRRRRATTCSAPARTG